MGLLGASALCSFGQNSTPATPSFTGEPFSASAADLTSAAATAPPDQRYAAQILFEAATYRVAADGTLLFRHHMVYRVDNAAGVNGWSEISAQWDPWFEKPVQIHARVLKPDGSFVELDQKTITDAPVKENDSETFSSGHVRRAPLPGVAIGSIVEETEITEEKTPFFSGGSIYGFAFLRNVPVGRERVTVELPSSVPFKDAVRSLPTATVTRSDQAGTRRVVYEVVGLPARHDSDIDLSTNTPYIPMVEFATGESWGKVATAYSRMSDPQIVLDDAKALLPGNLPFDRLGRIRAIVQRLHKEVRYTGVEFGDAQLTPQRPSEVIRRHYGDCKDKATLLVAMLRAAGIPANLALLSTGPGRQLDPDLPGMNRFDHAIVYVPAAGDAKPLWIDATAQFHEVGTLPFEDQGRPALIIAPETTALVSTPEPTPDDSTLLETRTYTLSELGPATVVEESQTHGYLDANYRASYGGPDNPKVHDDLENYVKQAYLAKSLKALQHGDGTDLSKPFFLTLSANGVRRGFSSMDEAVVAIFPNNTANGLPKWFSTEPSTPAPDASAEDKQEFALAQKSRLPSYVIRPFRYEQRSKILIPAGFTLRALPANKTTTLGTATLTETYTSEPRAVVVDFRFDSGQSTLTADQALALRSAILELNKREYVGVYFDQVGAKALNAGHIREALEADRALISHDPKDALHHVRLAMALLQAGIGDAAHTEARAATQLDPKSARAFANLGWTLQHNDLGERFGKGFDLPAAIAAYRKAIELDPDNNDARFDLAILCEFNARGLRYASDSDLTSAIATYRDLIQRTKDTDDKAADQYRENLLYALLYSRQFGELDKLLSTLPSSSNHTALAIASATAQHGVQAGIARSQLGNIPAAERNQDLLKAGTQLAQLHRYPEAADITAAGIQGGEDAPDVARRIEMYRGLSASSLTPLPATNPASPVQAMLLGVLGGTLTPEQFGSLVSHKGYTTESAFIHDRDKTLASSGFLRGIAEKTGMEEAVLLDLIAGNMKFTSTGGDANGYSVLSMSPGTQPQHWYVIRDGSAYRILGDQGDDVPLGNAILAALAQHNTTQAKAMLDWKRDLLHRAGGDDPFSGPLLPRFWTVGSTKTGADSPDAMHLAALSLLAHSPNIKPFLPEIAAARDKATPLHQPDLDLLLAYASIAAEDPATALPAARRLLDQEPESTTALSLAAAAYMYKNDPAGLHAMLAPLLAKKPSDRDLLTQESRAFQLARDFAGARAAEQKVLDSGKAEASDYNSYAWLGLFDNHLDEQQIKAAQQSNMLSKNASFADLHTLACVYAAQGRTIEARQVLKQAMLAGNQTEPNPEVWYALGLIYEQYGEKAAALAAYAHVKAHEQEGETYIDPVSTYTLAQARINVLSGTQTTAQGTN